MSCVQEQPTGGVRPNASENSQISPSTTVRAARGAGSHPHLASVLQEGRKSANIHAGSESSGECRINTASASHQGATLDFDDLQSAKSFGAVKAYGRSKLCNILFTRELARRLRGTGVTANCLHPGFVATRFGDQSGGLISHFTWFAKFFAISPAKGAETIIYLASSPEVAETTGQYFYKCRRLRPRRRRGTTDWLYCCGSVARLWLNQEWLAIDVRQRGRRKRP